MSSTCAGVRRKTAPMAPGCFSAQDCISSARLTTKRKASSKSITPAKAMAATSPSEKPAAQSGETPASRAAAAQA